MPSYPLRYSPYGKGHLPAAATAVYAHAKAWAIVIPPVAWAGGLGATIVIGAAAGLLPALRAAASHLPKHSGRYEPPRPLDGRRQG
jgi:hypothetical protein